MKRLLLIAPLVLLLLVNSCTGSTLSGQNNSVDTAVAGTHAAMTMTAAPTLTPNPNVLSIISWMNNDLSTISPLGSTLDAEYHVVNIRFQNTSKGVIFRVDVNCICLNSDKCCTPERTFVVIAETMKRNSDKVLNQVSGNINEILVVCSNQQSKELIGAMVVPWQDMKGYLQEHISGYQLGVRVVRTVAP